MATPTSPTSTAAPPARRPPRDGGGVTDLGRLLLGASVIALGVLFLLESADVLDAGRAIDRWWPLVIVAAGLLTLAERPPAIARGLVLTAIGGTLLLFTTDAVDEDAWAYVWPAAVIAAGLAIIARWRGRAIPAPPRSAEDEVVRSTAIFSGPHILSTARHFRGAWLTAVFGGFTLDLRGAGLAKEGASINATVAFGGIDILVPRGWRISVRSTPIFGGVDDKTDRSAPLPDDAPALRIDAVALFGGVDVRHEKK